MSCSLRTRVTVALAFAGGAFLYFSDHETLARNWRVALGLGLGAVVLALSPLWRPTYSTGRVARGLVFAITAIAVGGCGSG